MAFGLGSASAARAQTSGAQTPGTQRQDAPELVTLAAVGAPLADALDALIGQTGIEIAYETALVAGRTSHCRADRVPVEAALACVLRRTGLDYARLSSGTYVLLLDPEAPPFTGTLGGRVVDAETGAPLPGAHVVLAARVGSEPPGAATTADGRFALADLLPGTHRLSVSFVGYQTETVRIRVEPGGTARVEVALRSTPVLARPVVVSGLTQRTLAAELGQGTVPGETLTGDPPSAEGRRQEGDALSVSGSASPPDAPLAATPDVTAALDAVVGVSVGQALADVHVQGGSAGEHPLRLAGAPVFAPVSLGGLVGPFSPYAVERVVVHKAGFGAELGSHLAGVVEVEPLRAPLAGQVAVAEADALGFQGRWGGRSGSPEATEATWVVTARQSNGGTGPPALSRRLASWNAPDPFLLDRLGRPGSPVPAEGAPVDLSFTDLHAAGRVRLGGLRTLSASLYGASHAFEPARADLDDEFDDDLYEDAYRWTNLTGSARYESVLSGRAVAHVQAWASGFDLVRPSLSEDDEAPDANAVSAGGLSLGVEATPSRRQWVTAGLEITGYDSEISVTSAGDAAPLTADALRPIRATVAAVADDRIDLGRATLTVGTRATWLPETGRVYAEPRASLRYDAPGGPLGAWSARVGSGLYRQFVGAYDAADAGFEDGAASVRYWLPVGRGQRPPMALHLAAEGVVQPGGPWTLRAEGYLKGQPHLLVLDRTPEGAALADASGHAWGLAARAEHRTDRLRVALGYELSAARITQPGRFGGASVPAPWNVPHRVRLSADLAPVSNLILTVRAEALAGRTWGFRQAYYDLLEPDPALAVAPPFSLSDPGAHRLPLFAQLDLGAAYSREVGPTRLQLRVGLVNALGRANVRDWRLEPDGSGAFRRVPRLALPRFPTAALRVSL